MIAAFKIIVKYLAAPVLITISFVSILLWVVGLLTWNILILTISTFFLALAVELLIKVITEQMEDKWTSF